MKKILSVVYCFLFCCSCNLCLAQDAIKQDTAKNKQNSVQHTLFLELLGSSGTLYNITYDCSFAFAKEHKIATAVGVGYIPPSDGGFPSFGFSMQVNYLFGEKNHHLEIGAGIAFPKFYSPYSATGTYSSGKYHYKYEDWKIDARFLIPLRAGYRYQRSNGGFFWKIACVPMFSRYGEFFPLGGVAVGYTFKNKKQK